MLPSFRFLPVLAVVFQGPRAHPQTPVDAAYAAALQQKLDSCRNVYGLPGVSATLLLPGDLFWNGTAGVADIHTEAPMDTTYRFQEASVTKLFTATVVFQLIDEGVLALDDSIGTYLPPLPNVPGNTRIRYLLNHRSGIADHITANGTFASWYNDPDSIWPPALAIATFGSAPDFPQNTGFAYCNTNYVLLGMFIEQVTGHPFAQELHERITLPLGLTHTYFPPQAPVEGPLVPGWSSFLFANTYDTDVTPVLRDCFASMVFTAGALVSTPWDVAHFTRALESGAMVSPASLSVMRTCTNVSFGDGCNGYGHGTMRYIFNGDTWFGHSGDISGFTQMAIHSDVEDITFVLSINRNNAPRGLIAAALLGVVHQLQTMGVAVSRSGAPAFDLYPMPASDEVSIRSSALSATDRIDVVDAAGRIVRSERPTGAPVQRLSLEALAPGPYHVRLISRAGIRCRPLIVQ